MYIKRHPDFRQAYDRFCMKGLAAVGLAAALYGSSFMIGGETYDLTSMLVFFASVILVLALCVLRLYRVRCPDCRATTRVSRDTEAHEWVADCPGCRVR